MAHKTVEELASGDSFLMAGGMYQVLRTTPLSDEMTRVYFKEINEWYSKDYSFDMKSSQLFITY